MAQPTNNSSSGKSTKTLVYTYTDANGDTITLYSDGSESINFGGGINPNNIITLASNKDAWNPGANVTSDYEVFANNNGDTLDGRTTTTGDLALFGGNAKDILYAGGHFNY